MSYLSDMNPALAAVAQSYVNQSNTLTAVTSSPGAGQFLSSIIGRAPIPDIANDLRASLGIDRVQTQQIQLIQNEQGPNGEPVYGVVNDDRGLIRFVGSWTSTIGPTGAYIASGVDPYIELVFYGTGINHLNRALGTGAGASYSVDGGASSAIPNFTGFSLVLNARNYAVNVPIPVVHGLALGLHTIKIISTAAIEGYGFEILNANASGLININPGTAYSKYGAYVNSAADSIAYNTGVTGTKGGRIVRYMLGNDSFSQGFTPVDSSAAYGNSASHTNEEVARVYMPREFGAGRYNATYVNQDDFSLMAGGRTAAFTLDDGTTTLVGAVSIGMSAVISANPDGLFHSSNTSFFTFTFVGCGLDLLLYDNQVGSNGATDYQYSIDGGALTNWFYTSGSTAVRVQKIVSGLSYGTHTFYVIRNAATGFAPWFVAFKVYQPKKPVLPTGAVEICDYNVMATFDGATATGTTAAANMQIPQGSLTKMNTREFVYVGAGWTPLLQTALISGWQIYTANNSQPFQYTFFGTGISLHMQDNSGGTYDFTVTIDGSLNASGVARANASNLGGGSYRSTSTTIYCPCRVEFTGLTLGTHTIVITTTAGAVLLVQALNIITPIHVHKSNLYGVLQNTLSVGSQGLTDSRQTSAVTTIPKAWAQAVGITAVANTTSSTSSPVPDLSTTVKTSGGSLEIIFQMTYSCPTNGINNVWAIYVDGLSVAMKAEQTNGTGNLNILIGHSIVVPVSAGYHKVDVHWATQAGGYTMYLGNAQRSMTVREL
jgi:hypothetical protein